jgi:RNA polymerase sigma-32 factor
MYIQTGLTAWAKADRTEGVLSLAAEHSPNARPSPRFQARTKESVAEALLRAVQAMEFLSAADERRLALAWRDRADVSARNAIVRAHLPLVWRMARVRLKKANGLTPPIEDLVGEGVLAVYKAITRFDPSAPNRLATYAMPWIDGAIRRCINKHQSVVRGAAFDQLADPPRNDDDEPRASGVDAIDSSPSPEDLCELSRQHRDLDEAISHLGLRERRVFEARRMADHPITLAELSAELRVSIERVRQIEALAFGKVKKWITSADFSARMARSSGKAFRELPIACSWPHPGGRVAAAAWREDRR